MRECLDSIKGQTFPDWECIIVDDGSTDRSADICDEYAISDSRFKVFHTANGGLSAARNRGIAESHGRYIGFVDADDLCHREMYGHLYDLITKYNADVAAVSCTYLFKTFHRIKKYVRKTEVFDAENIAITIIEGRLPSYMCNKLFKRSVISSPFPIGKVFEDMYVMALWAKDIKRLVVSPQPYYYYRKCTKSISNSVSNYSFQSNFSEARRFLILKIAELYPNAVSPERINRLLLVQLISASKNLARNISSFEEAVIAVKRIAEENKDIPIMSRHDLGTKKWLRVRLIRNNPRTFVRLMRLSFALDFHQHYVKKQMFP